jgi:hypothetical protein
MLGARSRLPWLVLLTTALLLLLGSAALGAWSDLSDEVMADYGITEPEVEAISQGFTDGSWRPFQPITRAQFASMALATFGLPGATPGQATFADVPTGHEWFLVVEGASSAGLIRGYPDGLFRPYTSLTREQGAAIVVRQLTNLTGIEPSSRYTEGQITALLAPFGDAAQVSASLRPEVAMAVDFGVLRGTTDGRLQPQASLYRIQGAALLIRVSGLPLPVNYAFSLDLAGSARFGAQPAAPFDVGLQGFAHFAPRVNADGSMTVAVTLGAVQQDGAEVDLTGRDTIVVELDAEGNITSIDATGLGYGPEKLGSLVVLLNHVLLL